MGDRGKEEGHGHFSLPPAGACGVAAVAIALGKGKGNWSSIFAARPPNLPALLPFFFSPTPTTRYKGKQLAVGQHKDIKCLFLWLFSSLFLCAL